MKHIKWNEFELDVDEQSGALRRLWHPATGEVIVNTAGAGLLDLAYPQAGAQMTRLWPATGVRIEVGDGELTLTWPALDSTRPTTMKAKGPVRASVTIRALEDGCSLALRCRIENQSDHDLPQVLFPNLPGLLPIEGPERTELRLANHMVKPFNEPVLEIPDFFYAQSSGWREYAPGHRAPVLLRWLDFGGKRGGLSLFHKRWGDAPMPKIYTHRHPRAPLSLRLAWSHELKVVAGATWDSGEFVLTAHAGGWAKGIEPFRGYVKSVHNGRRLPGPVRDPIGFQTLWMKQSMEHDRTQIRFRFSDLPAIARDALAHGIREINLWGWCEFFDLPVRVCPELGTKEDLLAAIRKAKSLGVNITLFFSVQTLLAKKYKGVYQYDPNNNGNWTYHEECIPMMRPSYADEHAGIRIMSDDATWLHDVSRAVQEWLDAGVTSFCWDQFFLPDYTEAKKPELLEVFERWSEQVRAADPEASVSGESVAPDFWERTGVFFDYTWDWVCHAAPLQPLLNVLKSPRPNLTVGCSRTELWKGFMDGACLNLLPRDDGEINGSRLLSESSLSEDIKRLSKLRGQFLAYFTEGVCLGDSMLTDPADAYVCGHEYEGRLLVLALNDRERRKTVTLFSNLSLWLPVGDRYEIKVFNETGELLETRGQRGAHWVQVLPNLGPLALRVIEITQSSEA